MVLSEEGGDEAHLRPGRPLSTCAVRRRLYMDFVAPEVSASRQGEAVKRGGAGTQQTRWTRCAFGTSSLSVIQFGGSRLTRSGALHPAGAR